MNRQGFSLIELLIVLAVIGIVAAVAVPSLLQSKMLANETTAISTVRSLITAEATYEGTVGFGRYATDLASLLTADLIDSVVAGGTKDGYNFSLSGSNVSFDVEARPATYGASGTRSFYSDETGVIRYTTANAPASSASPPL